MASHCAIVLMLSVCSGVATANREALGVQAQALGANPIRKIVTLMQNMQKEIEAEGKKEKELFDKFMCFCSGNSGDLTKKGEDAKAQIDMLGAKLKAEEAEKIQIAQELITHK